MKHINFIPIELRPKLEIPGVLIPAGLVLLLVLYAGGSLVWNAVETSKVQNELTRLDVENAELTKKLETLSPYKGKVKQEDSVGSLKKVLAKKNYWSGIFREMSVLMPEGVWLTSFSDHNETGKSDAHSNRNPAQNKPEGGVLLIRGESASQEIIAQFLISLEKSHHFAGVQLMNTEKETSITPVRYKFEFSIPIKTATNGGG